MKVVKDTNKEVQSDFIKKWDEYKQNYIKEHSLEEMVYENGSALALVYKELQKLNTNIVTILNKETDGKES